MTKINPRDHLTLKKDHIDNAKDRKFPNTWFDYDDSWNFEEFKKQFEFKIHDMTASEMEFDMIGVNPALSNALRRVIIAEVPVMAIENVYFNQNTTIMHDELLAQRLGLVPLLVNPDRFDEFDGEPTDLNTLVFKLKMACSYAEGMPKPGVTDPELLYVNYKVQSQHLEWVAEGVQANWMEDIKAFSDIPLVEMRPGQSLEIECHARKGVGKDHAKFSPVCPCSFKTLPVIELKQPITGKDAIHLQKCFSKGVIGIKNDEAYVIDARTDTLSREFQRHDKFKNIVVQGKQKDYFIFNIESTGSIDAPVIVKNGLEVLKNKLISVQRLLKETDFYQQITNE